MDIRVQMLKSGVTQKSLTGLLEMTQPEISLMLKHELSQSEKKRIRAAIQKVVENDGRSSEVAE